MSFLHLPFEAQRNLHVPSSHGTSRDHQNGGRRTGTQAGSKRQEFKPQVLSWLPSLKLTAKTPEKMASQFRKGLWPSNYPFSGVFAVSFTEGKCFVLVILMILLAKELDVGLHPFGRNTYPLAPTSPVKVSRFESFTVFWVSLISGVDALKKCENDAHVIIAVVAQLQIWWWVGCWFDDIPVFSFHKEWHVSIGSWKEVFIMLTIPDLYYLHDSMIHIYFYSDKTTDYLIRMCKKLVATKSTLRFSFCLEAKLFWRDGKNAKARKWPGISVFVVQSNGKKLIIAELSKRYCWYLLMEEILQHLR